MENRDARPRVATRQDQTHWSDPDNAPPLAALVPKPLAHFLIAASVATVALLAVSHGDVNKMAYGDGLIYRYVATHLSTPPDKIDPVVVVRGTSLRYGRIGLPGMIWLAAAGQPRAMAYPQAIIIILSAGFAGAATASLFPNSGPIGA